MRGRRASRRAAGGGIAVNQIEARRASRSPQRSRGRAPRLHRGLDRLGPLDDRDGDGADRRQGLDPLGFDAAADGDARDAGLGRPPRDAERGLAERGLGVDPALAGDDQVRGNEPAREVGRLHQQLDARPQRERAEPVGDGRAGRSRRRRPRPRPGCRERAGPRPLRGRRRRTRAGDRARPRRRPTRPSAGRRRRPHRTGRGADWRRRRRRPGPRRPVAGRGRRDRRSGASRSAYGAESAQQARAAVGRGAAADAQDDRGDAGVQRGTQQVAGAGR